MARAQDNIRFGSDGWHARLSEGFTLENAVRLADAVGLLWSDKDPGATVYVGYDTRPNMAALAGEVGGVLASYGLVAKVADAPCPTPAIAWTCAQDPAARGVVMLTASERPFDYGGILLRGRDGGSVSRSFLNEVEKTLSRKPTSTRGSFEICDVVSTYRQDLLSLVDREAISAASPRIVVDAMYGAGRGLAASVLSEVGCEVVEIHDGIHPNDDSMRPNPQNPWAGDCRQAVTANTADFGLLLDGDCDRAAIVDETGRLVPARVLVPIVLRHLVRNRGQSGRVVTTLTCSACVGREAERLGLEVTPVAVGFPRIYRELREGDVVLACEEYGGISIPDHLRERDGLLVCLLLAELWSADGRSVAELASYLESTVGAMSYARRDVHLEPAAIQAFRNVLPGLNPRELAGRRPMEVSHADGLRLQFDDDAWVLLRPSRADAVVRVYAEAANKTERDALLNDACALVRTGM